MIRHICPFVNRIRLQNENRRPLNPTDRNVGISDAWVCWPMNTSVWVPRCINFILSGIFTWIHPKCVTPLNNVKISPQFDTCYVDKHIKCQELNFEFWIELNWKIWYSVGGSIVANEGQVPVSATIFGSHFNTSIQKRFTVTMVIFYTYLADDIKVSDYVHSGKYIIPTESQGFKMFG